MVARIDAVAWCSPIQSLFFPSCAVKNTYNLDVLSIGQVIEGSVSNEFLRIHNIPDNITRTPGSPWIIIPASRNRRRRRERKQKRGCRGGVLVRLRKQPHKPNIFLSNLRSLAKKLDINGKKHTTTATSPAASS